MTNTDQSEHRVESDIRHGGKLVSSGAMCADHDHTPVSVSHWSILALTSDTAVFAVTRPGTLFQPV